MPFLSRNLLASLTAIFIFQTAYAAETAAPLTLWYQQPAEKWTEALPIGNGRLGAMIFGGVEREHLQLNEGTLWAGGPYDPNNTNALAALPVARQLIFDGKYDDAFKVATNSLMAVPLREMPYQTMGDLFLDSLGTGAVENYRRNLDLDTAIATVSYTKNGVRFKREIFSSAVDQVIVVRLTANQPGKISFIATMKTPQQAQFGAGSNTMVLRGTNGDARGIKGALKFETRIKVLAEHAQHLSCGDLFSITGADSVTLLIAAATSYKNYHDVSGDPTAITKARLAAASKKSFDELRAAHIADYQKLFRRVQLTLDTDEALNLPTDARIKNFANGNDPQFATLYFQFARYLLISCSRPGGQAATLQGLWNDSMTPPWDSKYTININTEMNYWPAENGNLAECVEPLTQMVLEMAETGKRTAKIHYGAGGWVAHHNTDLWRATAPVDGPNSGMWPTGGAWLLQNLWEHYLFTGDKAYLKKIYPAMKGAAQFFLDTLVEEPTHHWLVTCPSVSPENKNPAAKSTSLGRSPSLWRSLPPGLLPC